MHAADFTVPKLVALGISNWNNKSTRARVSQGPLIMWAVLSVELAVERGTNSFLFSWSEFKGETSLKN